MGNISLTGKQMHCIGNYDHIPWHIYSFFRQSIKLNLFTLQVNKLVRVDYIDTIKARGHRPIAQASEMAQQAYTDSIHRHDCSPYINVSKRLCAQEILRSQQTIYTI